MLLGLIAGLALQAVTGGASLETAALQAQIDAAAEKGGGRVVMAPGVHRTGLLRLRSNVTLEIPAGAELSGSNDLADYGVDPKDRKAIFALVVAENATNVAIVGKGVINGNGGCFPEGDLNPDLPRPRLVYFHRCTGVTLEDVTLRDPCMWTCYFRCCQDVTARGVKIRAQANHNNDGFDIEARGVLIEGCDIDSMDDAVCFKSDDPDFVVGDAEVRNCTLASCSSAVKFGTSSYCAFRNVSIHDCVIKPTKTSPILDWSRPGNWWGMGLAGVTNRISGVSGLSLEAVDGGSLENVTVRNLTIKGYHTAIFMRQAERNVHPSGRPSVFRNVLVENVKAETVSSYANSITGTPGHRPNGITLRNIEIVCRGGGTVVNARYPVHERPWAYPENRCLGPLPAWGFYVRHADDVRFENVRLSLSAPDARDPVVVEDSTDVRTNGIVAVEHPEKPGVQYVDPMIGCAKDGHTYPGPTCPFGLVQPGPDSGNGDWAHCSGYVNADDRIYGFSQTHLSGTGCPDFGDVRLLPFMDRIADDASEDELYALKDLYGLKVREKVSEAFDDWSSGEMAQVGLYRVDLTNLYTAVSVTAGRRTAFYRFQKRNFGKFHLLVDPQWGQLWLGRRIEDHILSYSDRIDEDRMGLCGSFRHKGWLDRTVHFKIRFNRPFSRLRKLPSMGGEKASRYVLDFDDVFRFHNVEATIALSYESPEGAERNFAAEAPMGFDGARTACVAAWGRALSAVDVAGATRAQRTSFYTSLYHLMIQPNLVTDADETPRYSTFSLWDTFRAAHPLYTILVPDRAAEFANSMLAGYRRNGFLPVWEGGGDDNFCMIGNHAVPVVADAVLKGLPGVDRALAYEAVTNSLTVTHRCADGREKPKEDWGLLNRYGYYPYDLIEGEGVSRTLECAYDDACAMRLARLAGDRAGEAFFAHRAGNWTNVLDRSIGLVRGKDTRGRWREPFDPLRFGGGGEWDQYDCTEANAWQYTWHVLHDPQGLITALGGRDGFLMKLDELFVQPLEKDGWAVKHMTGRIGQYVQGNEPSHHIPYLYALAGRPDRTAEIVREVCDRFYLPKVDGLCGNDDCGQMSAWYVFACLGFYPLDPCGGEYVIGAPQLPRVEVKVKGEDGRWKPFTVVANNLSKENKYVKSVTLNGKPVEGPYLRHSDILKGGTLVFEMTNRRASDGCAKESSFVLVKDGIPAVEIVKTGDRTVDADITFFTNAVFRCTGAALPVVPVRTPGACAIVFDFVPDELFTADDWQVSFPDSQTLSVRGTAAWSCRWALNEILEKDLGVVFVMPGAFGTHYPQAASLAVPRRTRTGTASYKVHRELWRDDPSFARSLGGKKQPYAFGAYTGHGLWKVFPIGTYGEGAWCGKLMPERGGVRRKPTSPISGWQPCLSHPESVPEAVRRVLDHLRKHPKDRAFPLGMNDLEGWCECANCRKMNGGFETHSEYLPKYVTHSPSFWAWVNAVTEELLKVHPNLLIGAGAYCGALDPPPFKLNPHVTASLCIDLTQACDPDRKAKFEKLIAAWNEKAAIVGLRGYDYGSIHYLVPRVYNRMLADYICGNKRKYPSVNHVFAEGSGDCLSGEGPKRYIYYKTMFDPAFDLEKELTRWYETCCGKAAAPFLREYYDRAEAFWAGEAVKRTGWYKSVRGDYFNFDEQDYVTALTPADLDRATELMEKVVAAARSGDDAQQARAERLKTFHGYFVHRIRSFCYDRSLPRSAAEAADLFARLPAISRESRLAFSYADRILAPYTRGMEDARGEELRGMRNDFRAKAYEEVNPVLKRHLVAATDHLSDPAVQASLQAVLADSDLLPKIRDFTLKLGSIGRLPNLVKPDFVEPMERERRYRVQGICPGSELGVRIRIRNRGKTNRNFWLYFAPILPSNGSLNGHCARNGSVPAGAVQEFAFFGRVPKNPVWAGVTEGAIGVYDHAGPFSDTDVVVESVYACDFKEGKK